MGGGPGVQVIETSSLGDRSYLAGDGRVALVVDPQRDIDRVLAPAGRLGVQIVWVLETHLHNDYVSGGLALSRLTGARYGVAAAEALGFERVALRDGDVLEVSGRMRVRVVATPGHTFHHLSYVLEGAAGAVGVFTGGSLLFGTTGRTDLLGRRHAHELAYRQHASAHTLAGLLPDGVEVWPTHGFGSFCSAAPASGDSSTIGREKRINPVLCLTAGEFVAQTLAGLDAYPAYYAHMGARNAAGAEPVDLSPMRLADAGELARRLAAGQWVVDLRSRTAFADAHLVGTVSVGLEGPMATWLGWLVEWGAPVTLVGESVEQVAAAQRELVRVGIDRPAAAAAGTPAELAGGSLRLGRLPRARFADLGAALDGRPPDGLPAPEVVLDVRQRNEWRASHLAGAVHVPLPELAGRIGRLPPGVIWVHCASGYRATVAASLLARAGRTVVVVDDAYEGVSPALVASAAP